MKNINKVRVIQSLLIILVLSFIVIAGENSLLVVIRDYFILLLLGISFSIVIAFIIISKRAGMEEENPN